MYATEIIRYTVTNSMADGSHVIATIFTQLALHIVVVGMRCMQDGN